MSYLVITSKPGAKNLEGMLTPNVLGLEASAYGSLVRWLCPDEACVIKADAALRDTVVSKLDAVPADINELSEPPRPKRLLIADMDSTIITVECVDELADAAGLKPKVAAITERAMRGEIEFEPALRERVALLKGMPLETLQEVYETRVHLMSGAKTLIQTMRSNGALTVLASGGFTFFTSRVAAEAGFEVNRGNRLGEQDGALTGTVADPIFGRAAKRETLEEIAGAHDIAIADTMAVGDGANDLEMIGRSGLGVAFRAKPKVAAAAPVQITHGDLTALLYLQGISRTEFSD